MCDPISAAVGIGALTTVAGYSGQQQQLGYQKQIAQVNADRNNTAIQQNLSANYTQGITQQEELQAQASDASQASYLSTLKAADTASVKAASHGVSGHSVDSMLADILGQGAHNQYELDRTVSSAQQQFTAQQQAYYRNASASMQTPQVYDPGGSSMFFNSLLKGASAGMGVYGGTVGR